VTYAELEKGIEFIEFSSRGHADFLQKSLEADSVDFIPQFLNFEDLLYFIL
jgi:hypothetical protein